MVEEGGSGGFATWKSWPKALVMVWLFIEKVAI
jgi:hypothetical protein